MPVSNRVAAEYDWLSAAGAPVGWSGVEYVCPSTLSTVSFRSPEGGQKKTGMG